MYFEELSSNPFLPRILEVFDQNGDHAFSFQEFVLCLSVFSPRAPVDEKSRFLFRLYDQDNDGKISRSDLHLSLLRMIGNEVTPDEISLIVDKVFAESDVDRDGSIPFQEFEKNADFQNVMDKMSLYF
eukprot:TRINITY_DN1143_c1_g1_i1.p1 TRINITY_DN1143_c1_g1~~TRINITY_DN1143_c1_g1_i1.p1  ORF type:complete len:128 (+),score=30.23 TRINITY_DN1143_c1_g1_i1:251-634(+)